MARHYTRLDTTVCPDRDECARTFHLQLFEGDCCECCGVVMGASPCCPANAEYLAGVQKPGHSPGCPTIHQRK